MTRRPEASDKQADAIPVEGSLGLLALGAVGIKAWRKKKQELGYKNPNKDIFERIAKLKDPENKVIDD